MCNYFGMTTVSFLSAFLMRNYFPKRSSGAPIHTLSKLCDVPVGFVPPPSFDAVFCYICGRRRVAVARYRMICFVPVNISLTGLNNLNSFLEQIFVISRFNNTVTQPCYQIRSK